MVGTLKNWKEPGIDQITAEQLKVDTEKAFAELKRLFDLGWQEEKQPEQLKQGLICKIPKKGRRVTLLTIASQVLGKILMSRMQGGAEHRLTKEQAGFRPGRGRADLHST